MEISRARGASKSEQGPQARACSETKDVLNQEKENLFFIIIYFSFESS